MDGDLCCTKQFVVDVRIRFIAVHSVGTDVKSAMMRFVGNAPYGKVVGLSVCMSSDKVKGLGNSSTTTES